MPDGSLMELADAVWGRWSAADPLVDAVGDPATVEQLPDGSVDEVDALAGFARDAAARLDAIPVDDGDAQDALTREFLQWLLGDMQAAQARFWFEFDINAYPMMRAGNAAAGVLGAVPAGTVAGAARYERLLADYRDYVCALLTKLRGQRERGILLPRPALPGVRTSVAGSRERIADLVRRTPDAPEAATRLLENEICPRFDALLDFLGEDYERQAPEPVGCWQYPNGEDYYRAAVLSSTTLDVTPEQVHAVGVADVDRLTEALAALRSQLAPGTSEEEFHRQLAGRADLFAADAAEVEERYNRYLARVVPQLPQLFLLQPQAPYGLARLPADLQGSLSYGYYQYPTPLEPSGRYLYNTSNLHSRSLISAATLIAHELVPGHHFQIARQLETTELPMVRRAPVLRLNAFIEGWAEYAAGLGWELGLYDDPLDAYGRLLFERFFAQRLVVDTGMNALGWSLEQARDYMQRYTLESRPQIEAETLRYATAMPAQALAYRMGSREFDSIRAYAEEQLGTGFDVRIFHDQVLGNGALPLPALRHHVERWVRRLAAHS